MTSGHISKLKDGYFIPIKNTYIQYIYVILLLQFLYENNCIIVIINTMVL